jgi:hypothetical protein
MEIHHVHIRLSKPASLRLRWKRRLRREPDILPVRLQDLCVLQISSAKIPKTINHPSLKNAAFGALLSMKNEKWK